MLPWEVHGVCHRRRFFPWILEGRREVHTLYLASADFVASSTLNSNSRQEFPEVPPVVSCITLINIHV